MMNDTQKEQFTVSVYETFVVKWKTFKVVTRDGRNVEVLRIENEGHYPVVALIEGQTEPKRFNVLGSVSWGDWGSDDDLYLVDIKPTGNEWYQPIIKN